MAIAPSLAHLVRRITRAEYERMIGAGLFVGERVELWKGVIVEMAPQYSPHASAVQALMNLFVLALVPQQRAAVRVQLPFALSSDSMPEPDVAIVPWNDYRDAHPADAHLIIEVADSSLREDRGFKADEYAAAGVPEYWIVDVRARSIEVCRGPQPNGYRDRVTHRAGGHCSPDAFPDVRVAVDDVVGRITSAAQP